MRVGVLIDSKGLEGKVDLEALGTLVGDVASVSAMKKLSCAAVVHKIGVERLNGLVIVSGDEEEAWERGREALRLAREDPFALQVLSPLDLLSGEGGRKDATERGARLLRAAAAMVRQYPWLLPANIRMRVGGLGGRLSRRALLMAPKLRQEVVPAVDERRCRASQGCDLCLEACPFEAMGLRDSSAFIDKDRCRDCGLCVATCPIGAVSHPYYQRPVMEAGLRALLKGGGRGLAVAFACRGAVRSLREAAARGFSYPGCILPLEVPSAGFVDLYLLLRALDLGATGVCLIHCGGACGPACRPAVFEGRVLAAQALLESLAGAADRVAVLAASSPRRLALALTGFASRAGVPAYGNGSDYRFDGRGPGHSARLLLSLWERVGRPQIPPLEHDGLLLGQAELDASACSLCGLCADACPTGALRYEDGGGATSLAFDPSGCTGCQLCSRACPERALRVARRLDYRSLAAGRRRLASSGVQRCLRCGHGYAPEAMVVRMLSLLGDEPAADFRYCPDCRMLAVMGKA